MKRILLIGPMMNKINPSKTGGIIVLFNNLIEKLHELDIEFTVIDTNKENYSNKLIAFLSIYIQFLFFVVTHSHVSLHGTAKDYLLLSPFIVLISKLLNKKVSLRKFAGNFNEVYQNSNIVVRFFLRYVLKTSDINFFETKYLVKYFLQFNKNTFWFPNVRNKTNLKTDDILRKKFIFIGTISKEKGIDIILEASNLLSKDIVIDLYGTLVDYTKNNFDNYNVNYRGSLLSGQVLETMSKYDVLLLPSLREGYPGVIIEAFSIGLPIIATRLKGIEEMVSSKCAILIKKNDINALYDAMITVDDEIYHKMKKSSILQFQQFESSNQTKLFLQKIGY